MFKKLSQWLSNQLLTLSFRLNPPKEMELRPSELAIGMAHRTYRWINTPEQWKELAVFAASFGHKVTTKRYPTCLFLKNGKPYGYGYVSTDPVVFTAWHTDRKVCKPRDVMETFQMLSGWAKFHHGGAFVTAPSIPETLFTPEVMTKLGFGDTRCHLWEIRN